MCGIVYVKRKDGKPAYKSVLKRYRAQKGRGTDGFGYVAVKDNKVVSYKRATTEAAIIKLLVEETAPEILFHHRMPTSTPNLEEAAHPILVEQDGMGHQYIFVHNGVIRNHKELREKHLRMGLSYGTDLAAGYTSLSSGKQYNTHVIYNDSEALALETALVLEGKQYSIGTEGTVAAIGLQTKGPDVVSRFFFRNHGNPLKYHEDKHMITLTSIGQGEEVDTVRMHVLKEGGGFETLQNVYSPTTYKAYAGSPKGHWDRDKQRWVSDDEDKNKSLLPAPVTAKDIGFRMPAKKPVNAVLHFEDDDLVKDFPLAKDEGIPYRSITDLLSQSKKMNNHRSVVMGMTDDVLWDEYDKTIGVESELAVAIAQIDSLVESGISLPDTVQDKRVQLEDSLDKVKAYQNELSDEITAREAFGDRVRSQP